MSTTLLSVVTTTWGDVELRAGAPSCEAVADALYAPMRPEPGFGADPEWGLYDRDGVLVSGAALVRGPGTALVGQSARREVDRSALPVLEEPLIYGGPILLHYGHFVLSSLARMWAAGNTRQGMRDGRRVVWHADTPPGHWFQFEHVRTLFGALGLGPGDFVRPEGPCVLRDVVVPSPCFAEQSFVREAFGAMGRAIGRACGLTGGGRTGGGRPVYVSKTRLALGINRLNDEAAMEAELARRGFDVFHPTDVPLPAQMAALWRAPVIAGSTGSALHTTMFLPEPSRIIGLCPVNNVISNFPLVDLATGSEATYFHPATEPVRRTDEDPAFHVTWTLADPVGVAREIAERA